MLKVPDNLSKRSPDWWSERKQVWKNIAFDIPLLVVLLAVSFGISVSQWLTPPTTWMLYMAMLSMVATAIVYRCRRTRWSWYCILLSIASLAAWHHSRQVAMRDADELQYRAGDAWGPVVFEGKLDAVPRWRPDVQLFNRGQKGVSDDAALDWQTLLEIQVTSVREGQLWVPAHGRVTVAASSRIRNVLPGDQLRIYGKWERIPEPTNPGQFDLASFYRIKGQFARARTDLPEQVQKQGVAQRWRLDRWMGMLVRSGDEAIHRFVGKDQAALASALVLGQREQVEWDLQESMLATGTMHLLAISGLNIEMVAISVVVLASFFHLPRRTTLLLTAGLVICYAVLSGGQPPVIRAAVLVVTVCIGRWIGRSSHSLNLLSLAGLLLLAAKTTTLFDIGTQLSFLAVASIAIQSQHDAQEPIRQDPLDRLVNTTRPTWQQMLIDMLVNCWNLLRTSGWVWLITAPIILYTFHVLSPIAIVLNVALWLPVLGSTLSGLGLLILGTWFPLIGVILGWICTGCLVAMQWIVNIAEQIPASHCWLPAPSLAWLLGFYLIVVVVWAGIGFVRRRRPLAMMFLGGWLLVGVVPLWFGPKGKWPIWQSDADQSLRITFIDVGHGTSVLIQTPHNQAWLYDAGRMGDENRSFMSIAAVLWHEQIGRLDGIFLSHADSDHYNALGGITKRFPTAKLITTDQVLKHDSPFLRQVLTEVDSYGVPSESSVLGDEICLDNVTVQTLHPPKPGVRGSDNANSLCLCIEYGGRSVLLPGDLESPGTDYLIQRPRQAVDVLMAPHHGSLSDHPGRILDWAQPKIVTISGGERAKKVAVVEQFESDRRTVLVTARDGAIRIQIDRDGTLKALSWQNQRWNSQRQLEPSLPRNP